MHFIYIYVVTKRFELKWRNVDLIAGSRAYRTHEALSWSQSFSADIEAVEATKNAEKKGGNTMQRYNKYVPIILCMHSSARTVSVA